MSVIFQVLSNLKHNDEVRSAGSFFEEELKNFEHLVVDGVLRVVSGAKTIAEAMDIVASEAAKQETEAAKEASVEPENTWGPKKDEVPASASTDAQPDPEVTDETKDSTLGQVGQGDLPPDAPAGDNL